MRRIAGFEWDKGNSAKCQKHGLTLAAIESCFARPIVILPDDDHSQAEERLRAIGRDGTGRHVNPSFARSARVTCMPRR